MDCCGRNKNTPGDGEATSSSGSSNKASGADRSRSSTTNSELILLVGLHNFFNLDLLHRGWFMLSVDLDMVEDGNKKKNRRSKNSSDRLMPGCAVQLAMDSQIVGGGGSQNSSPERGDQSTNNSRGDNNTNTSASSNGNGNGGSKTSRGLKTYSAPFYIEYIEQDVLIQKSILYRITLENYALLETAKAELTFTLYHTATSQEKRPSYDAYTPAASEKITLSHLNNVQQYFVPLHFEKGFLSLTNVSIFASVGGLISTSSRRKLSQLSQLSTKSSLDRDSFDSWSSFLSLKNSPATLSSITKDTDQNQGFDTITEEDLSKESPEVLHELMERLQGTLSQLFVLESLGKTKQMSGKVSEFRQNLMLLPTLESKDPVQLAKEVMKILIELRKLCRFAIMQHTSPAQNMISFLFEHWRASRFRAWSNYIKYHKWNYERTILERLSTNSITTTASSSASSKEGPNITNKSKQQTQQTPGTPRSRKGSKMGMLSQQLYCTDERFTAATCPVIVTDQPKSDGDDYNSLEEPPILDILRLHEFPEVVSEAKGNNSTSFLNFLGGDDRQPKHIIFFVHGFMGGPQDLRFFHSFLKLRYPHVICHYSKENFKRTDSSFEDMGRRLAIEVLQVVERLKPGWKHVAKRSSKVYNGVTTNTNTNNSDKEKDSSKERERERESRDEGEEEDDLRISFVGHSIGNIIIRAALAMPQMTELRRFLWTFLSVSGPHTGFQGVNSMQKLALQFLTKMRKIRSICELSMQDEKDYKETFLYKLSKKPTFAHFRYVLLLGSKQDGYVPHRSATMTKTNSAASSECKIQGELVDTFIREMSDSAVLSASGRKSRAYRYIVDFPKLKGYSLLQQAIGRAAHVELLCSPTYIPIFTWCLLTPDMFALPSEKITIEI